MKVINPEAWARKNKKEFANKMITRSGAPPKEHPAAFFMAGLPGSGKTEFTVNLINELNLKVVRIDMDEIATHIEHYNPAQADAFRHAASTLQHAVYDRTLHRKVDFIMDGTFRSDRALENIDRALKKGYAVKVFSIIQKPEIAWSFTLDREKVEKRAISRDGFIKSYFEIRNNLRKLSDPKYKDVTIDIVIKKESNQVGEWLNDIPASKLDTYVKKVYTEDELERMLEQ